MTIDTLAFAKHLESAGIDRRAAEAHAEALARHLLPLLAGKADLDRAAAALEKKLVELEVWLIIAMLGTASIALGIAKAL